jgi:hypothetical protein
LGVSTETIFETIPVIEDVTVELEKSEEEKQRNMERFQESQNNLGSEPQDDTEEENEEENE